MEPVNFAERTKFMARKNYSYGWFENGYPASNQLVGRRFSQLTVIEFSHVKNEVAHWVCSCECGQLKTVSARVLKTGRATSCGCLHKAIYTLTEKKTLAKAYVSIRRKETDCEICGKQPIEWHSETSRKRSQDAR